MKRFTKRILAITLLIPTTGLLARGGHGGGHHGGGHHGGGHHGGGHHGHHSRGHHGHHGSHHGGHHEGHGHHGGHGWHGGGYGWGGWGWGWGAPWWIWGATAAIVAGTWYYGGYTIDQWEAMSQEDNEKRAVYETEVLPAYQQYQANPDAVSVREIENPA